MLAWARRGQQHMEGSPRRWVAFGSGIAVLLLLLGNAARVARMIQEKRLRSHPERFPEQAAAMWDERMARALARWGMQRLPGNTPQEFVRKLEGERWRTRVAQFNLAYVLAPLGTCA